MKNNAYFHACLQHCEALCRFPGPDDPNGDKPVTPEDKNALKEMCKE